MEEILLQVAELGMSYGKRSVLQEVSFTLKAGEILGLAGENGAGKSTLLSALAGIHAPKTGKIYFAGRDIYKNKRWYKHQMGYVPQDIALFEELSGRNNLIFFGKASRVPGAVLPERIREVCRIAEFSEEELKRPVQEYSGGMKRKINIGAALLHKPSLLLLDEPVANLDATSEEQVLKALKQLSAQGTAIVYVGHQTEKMEQFCDELCFIKNGKVIRSK